MEKFDIYDAQKRPTGKVGQRGIPLKPGEFRFVVRVILFNTQGNQVLIQQRQSDKKSWPDFWDFTAAGGVLSGESLAQAASRELFEELGFSYDFSNVPSRMTVRFYEGWSEIFFAQKEVPCDTLTLQSSEVAAAKWVTETELNQLIDTGVFIPFHYAHQVFEMLHFDGESRQN